MKKSSTSNSRVFKGHIDSALRTAWDEKEANVAAMLLGDDGAEVEKLAPSCSNLRRLIASACLLGGPRLLLGRSKVHGISNEAHALHGGPDSSH